jgi:hypothetical protein
MATETKMATRGVRISLPLAVGVDHGHPQWPDLSFFLSFFLPERQKWPLGGGQISLPLAVGVDRDHPQWPYLSFFFFFCSSEKSSEVGGGVCSPEVVVGGSV